MRRLSISLLLSATTGLMAILLIASVSVPVRFSTDQWRRAGHAEARIRASARLFSATEALFGERNAVNGLLGRRGPLDRSAIASLATRANPSLDLALDAYAKARAVDSRLSVAPLRQAVDARSTALRSLEAAADQPGRDRAAAALAWRTAQDRLSEVLERDAIAVLRPALADPFVAEMAKVRHMAWSSLQAAEADRLQIEALAQSGASTTVQERDRLAASLSEVKTRWALVDDEARLPTTPPDLKAAILAANRTYFGDYLIRRAATINAMTGAAQATPSSPIGLPSAEAAVAALGSVADAADRLAEAHAVRKTALAAGDTVGPIVLLIMALVLGGSGFVIIFTRLIQPLAILTQTMRRVSEGDLDRTIPYGKQTDEIGDLARALELFRESAVERLRVESELLRAQSEAKAANDANQLKSQFLANISHEIRTPLNGVLGMAQAIAGDELSPVQRQRLDVVRQSGEALQALLNDLLDLARIEAGKFELEMTDFDLAELVSGAGSTFSGIAEARNLAFDLTIDASAVGRYRGDPTRVRQILFNLVSNALKFTMTGSVRVEVSRARGRLRIVVTDTGIGMSKAALGGLFQSFAQAEASTSRRFGGSGLGLAICRELAELMGGKITAKSQEGVGSAFTVTLPLQKLSGSKELAGAATNVADQIDVIGLGARRPNVLAAEDNATNGLVLRTLLEQLGVEVELVENGALAVEAWQAKSWDLILMDVQMPVMDGIEATRAIRAAERATGRVRTPIVALTANAMSHQVGDYMDAGMDDCVSKPISVTRLMDAVVAALPDPTNERAKTSAPPPRQGA